MQIKEDCFAYMSNNKHKGCFALKELFCCKENCKFYQNKEVAKKQYLDNYNLYTASNISKEVDDYFRKKL